MSDRSRLYILIVNWNGWCDTLACLESIFKGECADCRVIVCDNGSEDDSLDFIKAWANGMLDAENRADKSFEYLISPPCRKPVSFVEYDKSTAEAGGDKEDEKVPLVLIKTGANLGFAGGNNVGLRYILSRAIPASQKDYIILLNSDTVVFPDALAEMKKFMESTPSVGACGARLFYADGSPQPSYGCFPTIPRMLVHLFPIHKLFPQTLFKNFKKLSITPNAEIKVPIKVDYPSGACLMVSREVIDEIGSMDERFFAYFEETDWCYAMRTAGWDRYYVPNAKVVHYCGGSFNHQELRRRILSLESRFKFFKKNFSVFENFTLLLFHLLRSAFFMAFWKLSSLTSLNKPKAKDELIYNKTVFRLITGLDRYLILMHYIKSSNARNRVSFYELSKRLTAPPYMALAKKYCLKSGEDGEHILFKIKGFNDNFIWPKALPESLFYQVVAEGMNKKDWHYYEVPETDVAAEDVVVDCGAAEGFFTFKHYKKAKHIYAIEPLPMFTDLMRKMFSDAGNISILNFALFDKEGIAILSDQNLSSHLQNNGSPGIQCRMTTMDELFFKKNIKVDYIKADLEGSEERFIKGCLKTIEHYRPKIAITTYHLGQDWRQLIAIIKNVVPEYKWKAKGIEPHKGNPVMLHFWCEKR